MNITVRYFASIRETLGCASETLDTQAADVAALKTQLLARSAAHAQALAADRPVRVAVNQVMARDDTVLSEGAEVGFFPPVTGG